MLLAHADRCVAYPTRRALLGLGGFRENRALRDMRAHGNRIVCDEHAAWSPGWVPLFWGSLLLVAHALGWGFWSSRAMRSSSLRSAWRGGTGDLGRARAAGTPEWERGGDPCPAKCQSWLPPPVPSWPPGPWFPLAAAWLLTRALGVPLLSGDQSGDTGRGVRGYVV